MIEKLTAEVIETGQAHPFVEAFVKDLRMKHARYVFELESKAADGDTSAKLSALGGRCAEVRDLIRVITTAKGEE